MKVYFDNDGSYGEKSVKSPIIVNGKPIGFIAEVSKERVTCFLFDRYVYKEQIGCNVFDEVQDIRSIGISN